MVAKSCATILEDEVEVEDEIENIVEEEVQVKAPLFKNTKILKNKIKKI